MASTNLTSLEWCDLIFKGKNKSYGAYRMRRDFGRRQTAALLIVAVAAIVGFTLPKLIQMVLPEPKEENLEVTQFATFEEAKIEDEHIIKRVEPTAPPPALKSTIKFTAPVIADDKDVSESDELKSQDELTEAKVQISIADVKGNDELNGKDIADLEEVITNTPDEDTPLTVVEQMPQFPGGEQALMEYISKHIRYPQYAIENGIMGRVFVRFVVTATGEVTNVTVVRSLDPTLDKEAIRVVQALPKWIPGKQNGRNVPVYFTLPIMFRLQ